MIDLQPFDKYLRRYGHGEFLDLKSKAMATHYFIPVEELETHIRRAAKNDEGFQTKLMMDRIGADKTLLEHKLELVVARLIKFNGNRSEASRSLSISIRTMRNYITLIKEEFPHLAEIVPKAYVNEAWRKESEFREKNQPLTDDY